MRRIGLVVNPIAGMGGRVGLKGTDGKVAAARERGAEPRAPGRAREALDALREYVGGESVELVTYGGPMGEDVAREADFDPVVVGNPENFEETDETTAADTRAAVRAFVANDVDLVLFVGGDGTAADVAETLEDEGSQVPMFGVPAGVKIYSSVFAVSPRRGSRRRNVLGNGTGGSERRRRGPVPRGRGPYGARAVATVPVAEQRQSSKQLGGGTVETLAAGSSRTSARA